MSNSHSEHGLPRESVKKPAAKSHTPVLLLVIALLIGIYGIVGQWDSEAELQDLIINMQLAHAADRLADEQDLAWRVSEAYAQGQRDAMAAVKTAPTGLALAQACQAWLRSDDLDRRQASTEPKPARPPAGPAARTSKGV